MTERDLRAKRSRAAADRPYPITENQSAYFVANSLQDARERISAHCRQLSRPFYARFNPTTDSIWVDRSVRRQAVSPGARQAAWLHER